MKKSNRIIQVGVAAALATLAGAAAASGLAIGTQSGSGTGNAFAGGSAVPPPIIWTRFSNSGRHLLSMRLTDFKG